MEYSAVPQLEASPHLIAGQRSHLCRRCFNRGRTIYQSCSGNNNFSEITECETCDKFSCGERTAGGQSNYGPSFCKECVAVMGTDDSSSEHYEAAASVYVHNTITTTPGHYRTVIVAAPGYMVVETRGEHAWSHIRGMHGHDAGTQQRPHSNLCIKK